MKEDCLLTFITTSKSQLKTIVLGYFVNTGTIEYRGKAWNAFNTFFTLITGIATLIGFYLQVTSE